MIKLIKSTFFNEEKAKALLCVFIKDASVLSMATECKKFEEGFAKKQGRKYAVFVNSGSSANLILVQALLNLSKLKKGDLIGVSAVTWPTNIMPLIQLGLVPILIDCEVDTLNVSPRTLASAFAETPNIKGLFLTNVLGFSDDIESIASMCAERGALLFEDNCESLGSSVGGKLLGNFGIASTFSFFAGHHLSTIEGGMVCTDDMDLYHALIPVRAHGWDRNLSSTEQILLREKYDISSFFAKYAFYDLAYNVRPTEINGFLGNLQLEYWDIIVDRRNVNFKFLHNAIVENKDLIPLRFGHMDIISNFAVPMIAKTPELMEKYRALFEKNDVEVRPIITGNMASQPFFKKYITKINHQPGAEFIHNHGFYFGNNPELTEDELELLKNLILST